MKNYDQNKEVKGTEKKGDDMTMKNENKEVKVALYCNIPFASDDAKSTMDEKLAVLKEAVAQHPGWTVTETYTDTSEDTTVRPQFTKLVRNGMEKKFDVIVVDSMDEFADNLEQLVVTANDLKNNGVTMYFLKDQIDTSYSLGKLLLEVVGNRLDV